MSNYIISPSLLNANVCHFKDQIREIEYSGATHLHIDIMDGNFVPNMSFGPKMIKEIKEMTSLKFDVHLMVEHPENIIDKFVNIGVDMICFHLEATKHVHWLIKHVKATNTKVGIAINPGTPIAALSEVIDLVDYILVMTINPGRDNETFIENSANKIKQLNDIKLAKNLDFIIEVDGNITADNIQRCHQAGASMFVSGGYIFNGESIKTNILKLQEKLQDE